MTVGSVDDGKSTLIGRLLHDTKGVYDDQLKDATRTSKPVKEAIDFARLTDGLQKESRESPLMWLTVIFQHQFGSSSLRIRPGHVQYTRNMATGASTANVAIILIDARLAYFKNRSRRHAYIASLLGILHLFVGVNKMDLVDYERQTFEDIKAEFEAFSADLGFTSVDFVPISALMGISPWWKPARLGRLGMTDPVCWSTLKRCRFLGRCIFLMTFGIRFKQ